MLLNPSKLYICVTKCKSFGFLRTLEGSTISDGYKNKVLAFEKPKTAPQMKEFLGIINYIGRYLHNYSKLAYWLNRLVRDLPDSGRIKWNNIANTAFEQIRYLVEHAPLLHAPTIDGTFCIKCDACNYGIGAVLYQQQVDPKTGKLA